MNCDGLTGNVVTVLFASFVANRFCLTLVVLTARERLLAFLSPLSPFLIGSKLLLGDDSHPFSISVVLSASLAPLPGFRELSKCLNLNWV